MQIDRKNEPVVQLMIETFKDCNSMLDLGCGQSSTMQYIPNIKFSTGVEVWKPYIDESKKYNIHTEYVNMDITKFNAPDGSYDGVMCIDVLEHINKIESIKLLKKMKRWANKKILIYVPNGFMPQEDPYEDGNKYQEHISSWHANDLRDLGFDVVGFAGLRCFRGEGADIKIKSPGILRNIYSGLSLLSEPFCRHHPEYAFHLCGIYTKD